MKDLLIIDDLEDPVIYFNYLYHMPHLLEINLSFLYIFLICDECHGAAEGWKGDVDNFIGKIANKVVNLPLPTSPSAVP